MIKKEALLLPLNQIYDSICNEDSNEEYYTSLESEVKKDEFGSVIDNIESDIEKIISVLSTESDSDPIENDDNSSLMNYYDSLIINVNLLNSDYSAYFTGTNMSYRRVIYDLYLSLGICSFSTLTLDNELREIFDFIPTNFIPPSFTQEDADSDKKEMSFISEGETIEKSIVIIKEITPDALESLIGYNNEAQEYTCNVDIDILHSLFTVNRDSEFQADQCYIFKSKNLTSDRTGKDIEELLKIHMVSRGKPINPIVTYNRVPNNGYLNNLIPGNKYSQFSEVIHIIGDYMNQTEVLHKYLLLYQIIENFMYRFPIVKLERRQNGNKFTIRNFRNLYNTVNTNEKESLKQLINKILNERIDQTQFAEIIKNNAQDVLKSSSNRQHVDNFFQKIHISFPNNSDSDKFIKFLSEMIYTVRCSIVHNKETEYHLSSMEYQEGAKIVLEEFLLPTLEEMIFFLICNKNDIVWYENDHLKLYESQA